MLKQILSATKVVLLALVLSFGLSYALAWTAPTATPPGANVAAPINAGSSPQEKLGGLTAGSLTTTGLTTTGTLRVTTGAGAAKVLTSDASGNATWQTPSTGADNLGNHTATQDLSLGANNILATGADVAHGTLTVQGAKAGWAGINFRDAAGTANYSTLMMNAATSGFYNNAHTGWRWQVNESGNTIQAGTITASGMTVTGNVSASDVSGGGKWLSATQNRVSGTCAAGSAVRVVNANGTVTCQALGPVKYGGSYASSDSFFAPCPTTNLVTGACSCPSGYTARRISNFNNGDSLVGYACEAL